MTLFAVGFLFISLFTVFVGIAAVIFVSFDAIPSDNPRSIAKITGSFPVVRRINTHTIETVDTAGLVQQWQPVVGENRPIS